MVRGARIDLDSSAKALFDLQQAYVRDFEAREISDEAIAAVNASLRSLEGALGKTANAVQVKYQTKPARTYFPLTDDPSCFPGLLDKNIPGLASSQPEVAEAFERHQPYQPGRDAFGLLKALYRENHHHDFTVQERRDARSHDLVIGGGVAITLGSHGMTIGGPPPWRGIPVRQRVTKSREDSPVEVELREVTYVDWYFKDPNVSVLETLVALHNLCVEACGDVSSTAGL